MFNSDEALVFQNSRNTFRCWRRTCSALVTICARGIVLQRHAIRTELANKSMYELSDSAEQMQRITCLLPFNLTTLYGVTLSAVANYVWP